MIVSARLNGGLGLFLVPADAPGLTRQDFRGPDNLDRSEVCLHDLRLAPSALLAPPDQGAAILATAFDRVIVARLAEALGCMEALRELTLEYLKTRQQFGVLIGSFQVLQHRMVDIAMAVEESRSLLLHVAGQLELSAQERAHAVSAAKVRICHLATFVAQQSVQLHGAIGMTDALAVGHYLKRLMMIAAGFGSIEEHRDRFIATRPALVGI